MKKRLIEYNLPLADISEASASERRDGHPSTLHVWWARRPLAASRATAFAALVNDPGSDNSDDRDYLLELIKKIIPWETVSNGDTKVLEEARQLILNQFGYSPKILDPFSGGGAIPLETLRLGCETFANDYNPVAVLLEKATIEWPQKYGMEIELQQESVKSNQKDPEQLSLENKIVKTNILVHLVDKWARTIFDQTKTEIEQFYPKDKDGSEPFVYLWARTIICNNPNCQASIPLIPQFWIANKNKKKIAYQFILNHDKKTMKFEILESEKLKML